MVSLNQTSPDCRFECHQNLTVSAQGYACGCADCSRHRRLSRSFCDVKLPHGRGLKPKLHHRQPGAVCVRLSISVCLSTECIQQDKSSRRNWKVSVLQQTNKQTSLSLKMVWAAAPCSATVCFNHQDTATVVDYDQTASSTLRG